MKTSEVLKRSMGKIKADIILVNGTVVNVYTRELIDANVVVSGERIVYIGKQINPYKGDNTRIINVKDKVIIPGLIESHIHIESSMLSVTEFTNAVIPHGTTTCVVDPHELVNVLGIPGLDFFIEETKKAPIRYLVEAPSCVPSLPGFETPGALLNSKKIKKIMRNDDIFGLAEVMNYPGVIYEQDDILQKIEAAKKNNKLIEGHAPLLSGKELQAYIAAGITSDHEASSSQEVLEKLRLGMKVQVREGSFAKDLKNILSELDITKIDTRHIILASDDRNPIDLVEKGHLDYTYKVLLELGLDPFVIIQMMTINTAQHLGIANEIGGIAPGKIADIVVVDSLKSFNIEYTIAKGKILYEQNELKFEAKEVNYPTFTLDTTKFLKIPSVEELLIPSKNQYSSKVNVIGLKENSLITEKLTHKLKVKDNLIQPDIKNDILPVVVLNRHTKEEKIGKGFVKGLGIKNGALASTVAHDCHQLICVGTDTQFMVKAISKLKESGGGQVVVTSERLTLLPLRFAGIMSIAPLEKVIAQMKNLHHSLQDLNPTISEPFMALAFLALPVIPHLKLTDHGLVDVDEMKLIDLEI